MGKGVDLQEVGLVGEEAELEGEELVVEEEAGLLLLQPILTGCLLNLALFNLMIYHLIGWVGLLVTVPVEMYAAEWHKHTSDH